MAKKKKSRVSESSKFNAENETENHQSDAEMGDDNGSSDPEKKSLYEILGVQQTVSQQEIKKAYHKLALRLHPDKNPDDKEANEKFQQLQKVMSILGDEEKRAIYDHTGMIDDDDLAGDTPNFDNFFRTMFKEVTVAAIEEFEASYRASDSEKKDLINLYTKYKGNMKRLFCSMLCSDSKLDSHRFKDILDKAIASGEVKEFKAYKKWAKEISEIQPPTNPLRRKKLKKQGDTDLYAIIAQRREQRKNQFDKMFSSMISRYGGENSSEPSEEEFAAAQEKLKGKRASKKSRLK